MSGWSGPSHGGSVTVTLQAVVRLYSPAEFAATSPLVIWPRPWKTGPVVFQIEYQVTAWLAVSPVTLTWADSARSPEAAAAKVAALMPAPSALDVPDDPGSPECS